MQQIYLQKMSRTHIAAVLFLDRLMLGVVPRWLCYHRLSKPATFKILHGDVVFSWLCSLSSILSGLIGQSNRRLFWLAIDICLSHGMM